WYRHGEIERAVLALRRNGNEEVTTRELLVRQPIALRAEHERDMPGLVRLRDALRALARLDGVPRQMPSTCAGSHDEPAVRERALPILEPLRALADVVR